MPTRLVTVGLFLLPALALYGLFVLFPIVQAAHYSLFKWNGLQPLTDFVGLDNYVKAFNDKGFRTAVSNNLLIIVLSLAIQIPFAPSARIEPAANREFAGRIRGRALDFRTPQRASRACLP